MFDSDSEKDPKAKIRKKRIMKLVFSGFGFTLPFLFFIIIALIAVIMAYTAVINKAGIAIDIAEKSVNILTGQGWVTSEDFFTQRLSKEMNNFNNMQYKNGFYNVNLAIAATHYNRLVTEQDYKDSTLLAEKEHNLYNYASDHKFVVPPDKIRSFYRTVNGELGSSDTLFLGQKRLLGHMVRYELQFTCTKTLEEAMENWKEIIRILLNQYKETLWEAQQLIPVIPTPVGPLVNPFSILYYVSSLVSFSQQGTNYIEFAWKNLVYEGKELAAMFGLTTDQANNVANAGNDKDFADLTDEEKDAMTGNSSEVWHCPKEEPWPSASISKTVDLNLFRKYLLELYVPYKYVKCKTCAYRDASPEEQAAAIKSITDEIMVMGNSMDSILAGPIGTSGGGTTFVPGFTSLPLGNWDKLGYSSYFGAIDPIRDDIAHTGLDITSVTKGYDINRAPAYSIADGYVIDAGWLGSYGNRVKIGYDLNGDGKFEYIALYAHLSEILVSPGQKIGGGQTIGLVGSTGNSTGPHLHFELRIKGDPGIPIDPLPIINGIKNGNSEFDQMYGDKNKDTAKEA